jgi:3-oxoacyl-[acyl-carrier protein] reductase
MSTEKLPLALVTGGSRGIGAAICKELAKEGYHVAINYSSNTSRAESVLTDIKAAGGTGELCGFDVSNSAQVEEKIAELGKTKGPLAVLVNNAGISIDGLLIRMKDSELDQVLSVDLKGAIYCTREASKQMMRARKGSIIQIASVVGEMGNAGQSAYSAAKSGLIGFSKTVAKELASRHVRCNVITPGYISTEMTESLTETQKEAIVRNIPMGTLGTPQDVASLVAFLASSKSQYISGQVIGINGGLYM